MRPLGAPGGTKQHPPPAEGPRPPRPRCTEPPQQHPPCVTPREPSSRPPWKGGGGHFGPQGTEQRWGRIQGTGREPSTGGHLYPLLGRVGGYWCGTGATCWAEGTVPTRAGPNPLPKGGGGHSMVGGILLSPLPRARGRARRAGGPRRWHWERVSPSLHPPSPKGAQGWALAAGGTVRTRTRRPVPKAGS